MGFHYVFGPDGFCLPNSWDYAESFVVGLGLPALQAIPLVNFALVILEIASLELFAWAGFKP
jgi:hypothetical protein